MMRVADSEPKTGLRLPEISVGKPAGASSKNVTSASGGPAIGEASLGTWQIKMPPIETGSGRNRWEKADASALAATGRTLDRIKLEDLQKNSLLQSDVGDLRLNEFFDHHGSLRLRRVGLTFAARQNMKSKEGFGHSGVVPPCKFGGRTTATSSAKAFFLATSAVERDLEQCKVRSQELYNSVRPCDKLKIDDVNQRQLEIVFNEIPLCHIYFPIGVAKNDFLPVEMSWETQIRETREAERMSLNFSDKGWGTGTMMGWMFTRTEIMLLSKILGLWVQAYRPNVPIMGMDRMTFCRLILDLGLVDQDKVPYFWAVALFDSVAKPMRWCTSQLEASTTPLVPTVSSWILLSIIDVIVRSLFGLQRTGSAPQDTRRSFLMSTFDIARYKLPARIIEESGLKADQVDRAINYGEDITKHSAAESQSSFNFSRRSSWTTTDDTNRPMSEISESVASNPEAFSELAGKAKTSQGGGHEFLQSDTLKTMLVEPEVLHVVAQHRQLFKELFCCYLDCSDMHMTFSAFRQFCVDFHFSPALVSCNFLQLAYETSSCLEHKDEVRKTLSDALKAKGQRILIKGLKSGELGEIIDSMEAQERRSTVTAAPNARKVKTKEFSSSRTVPANPVSKQPAKPSASKLGTSGTPRSQDPGESLVKQKDSSSKHRIEGPQPWAKTFTSALVAKKRGMGKPEKELPGRFGLNAFVETLCRIAFAYLSTYGNNSQMTSPGYVRIVWFISYLRCVSRHLRESLDKRNPSVEAEEERCEIVNESLKTALTEIDLELWDGPRQLDLNLLPPVVMRPLLPENARNALKALQKKTPSTGNSIAVAPPDAAPPESNPRIRRRSSSRKRTAVSTGPLTPTTEADQTPKLFKDSNKENPPLPCVTDGVCSLCQVRVEPGQWGNPRCRGCSVVDRVHFENHVFKRLLLDGPRMKLKMPVVTPAFPARKHAMTPPPMGVAHALRKQVVTPAGGRSPRKTERSKLEDFDAIDVS